MIDITEDLASPQVLEQNDYLPFGTKIQNPDLTCWMDNRWQYAGKEAQRFAPGGVFAMMPGSGGGSTVDLGLLNFGARMYDPFTARWTAVDLLANKVPAFSPTSYCNNNPILFYDYLGLSTHTDYEGNVIVIKNDGDLGVYRHNGSREEITEFIQKYHSSNNTSCGGEMMGETWFIDSFTAYGEKKSNGDFTVAKDAKIGFESDELSQVVDGIISDNPSIIKYAFKARSEGEWDIKTQITEGSILYGKYASPRDAGNIAAGMFSASKGKILSTIIDYGYGAYNLNGNSIPKTVAYIIATNSSPIAPLFFFYTSIHGEDPISKQRQDAGHQFYKKYY